MMPYDRIADAVIKVQHKLHMTARSGQEIIVLISRRYYDELRLDARMLNEMYNYNEPKILGYRLVVTDQPGPIPQRAFGSDTFGVYVHERT